MASTETGWTSGFTAIGYYWLREQGEDIADASVIEYQGGERAYIVGADDNFYEEWTSGRYEFLGPLSPSDAEQLIELRKAAQDAHDWIAVQAETWTCQHADEPMRCSRCSLRQKAQSLATALRAALNLDLQKEGQ